MTRIRICSHDHVEVMILRLGSGQICCDIPHIGKFIKHDGTPGPCTGSDIARNFEHP